MSNPIYAPGDIVYKDYDDVGRPTGVRIPLANNPFVPSGEIKHEFRYKPGGALHKTIDSEGKETVYDYHDDGRLSSITYPASSAGQAAGAAPATTQVACAWTADRGLLDTIGDARSVTTKFDYDGNRITQMSFVLPSPVPRTAGLGFDYDGNGMVTGIRDLSSGDHVTYRVDALGMDRGETQRHGAAGGGLSVDLTSSYDSNGRRLELEIGAPVSQNHKMVLDRLGRMGEYYVDNLKVADIGYVHGARRNWLNLGNIRVIEYLDEGDFLEGLFVTGLQGGAAFSWTRRPDKAGRCASMTWSNGALQMDKDWQRDELGRITEELHKPEGQSGTITLKTERVFDGDDVLRSKVVSRIDTSGATPQIQVLETVTATREERGRITTRNGVTIQYDVSGGLKNDGTYEYVYDGFMRLIEVKSGGQVVVRYDYDGLHRMIRRTAGG